MKHLVPHSSISTAALAALIALVAAVACGEDPAQQRARGPSAVSRFSGEGPVADELFLAASEFNVPVAVLAAAAYSETRLVFRDADSGESTGRGLFQLDEWAIDEAAVGLHETPERVATDPQVHARAFAWLLFRGAVDEGDVPAADDADAWVPRLAAVRAHRAAGTALVEGAGWALDRGFLIERPGERLRLEPDPFGRAWQAARPDQPGVRYIQSVNYRNGNRGPGDVDTVVIHMTQGSYGGTINWFQNPDSQVSSHYVVRSSDGEITQMVEEEDVAWHASCWNNRSVGIEHEGFVDDPAWFTEEMYRSSAALTRGICERWGIPMDRAHIKGHVELSDCNDHTDPGNHWDWDHYIALVRGEAGPGPAPQTGTLMGFVREGDLHNEAGPIAGAVVSVEGGPEVQSGGDGLYQIDGLMAGHYVVHISAGGFEAQTIERDVAAGGPTWGSVGLQRMAPAPPSEEPAPEPDPKPGDDPDAALSDTDAATPIVPAAVNPTAPPSAPTVVEVDAALVSGEVPAERASDFDGGSCQGVQGATPRAPWALLLLLPVLQRRFRTRVRDKRAR